MVINVKKSQFGKQEMDFLGHHISTQGIRPLDSRISAIQEFPTPTTIRKLREFTGSVTFYHRFQPHLAEKLAPFHDLMKGRNKKAKLVWSDQAEESFQNVKKPLLRLFLYNILILMLS